MISFFKKLIPKVSDILPFDIQADGIEWFEVWYEGISALQFNFLLLAKEKNRECYVITDICRQNEIVATFENHEDARLFLLEDEFSRVSGRTYEEDF